MASLIFVSENTSIKEPLIVIILPIIIIIMVIADRLIKMLDLLLLRTEGIREERARPLAM